MGRVRLVRQDAEGAQYRWPRIGPPTARLNDTQLSALVDGLDWKKIRPVVVKRAGIDGLKKLWHFESGLWKVWGAGREHAVMAAMTKAVAELPDDVDALKAIIVAMADQRALLEAATTISKW